MNVFRLVPRLDPCGHELASRNTLAYSLFIYFNAKRKKKKKNARVKCFMSIMLDLLFQVFSASIAGSCDFVRAVV